MAAVVVGVMPMMMLLLILVMMMIRPRMMFDDYDVSLFFCVLINNESFCVLFIGFFCVLIFVLDEIYEDGESGVGAGGVGRW